MPLPSTVKSGGTVTRILALANAVDAALRIPVGAVAVHEARLGLEGDLRKDLLPHRDGLPFRRHWRQAPAIRHAQAKRLAAAQRVGQVDDDVVLAAHAQGEQPAELVGGHRAQDQRLGEAKRQRLRGGAR